MNKFEVIITIHEKGARRSPAIEFEILNQPNVIKQEWELKTPWLKLKSQAHPEIQHDVVYVKGYVKNRTKSDKYYTADNEESEFLAKKILNTFQWANDHFADLHDDDDFVPDDDDDAE